MLYFLTSDTHTKQLEAYTLTGLRARMIDENIYIKNAFYIMICDSRKEMNETVAAWNNNHKNSNRLMSWDEMTEVIK